MEESAILLTDNYPPREDTGEFRGEIPDIRKLFIEFQGNFYRQHV
jgi:hypothetical protein